MSNPLSAATEPSPSVLYPRDKTLVDLLVEQAAKTPDSIAVTFGHQQLTYRELDEQSNQLAHYLRRCGLQQETLVPVCLDRSLAMIISLLGVLKAGGAYVPIDPDYPEERIRYMLSDVNGRVVIGDDRSRAKLTGAGSESIFVWIDSDWPTISKESIQSPQTELTPQNAAYVIYTSGSTGRPKGVIIEHENVVRLFITDTPLFDFGPHDVWTMFHSFCFDFSVWEMYGALLFGGRLVVVPKAVAQDARLFGKLLADECVTVLNQTPSAFYVLQEQAVGVIEYLSVRYVIFGGEALNPAKLKPWKGAYPNCQLINMYGITETTVHVTFLALDDHHLASSNSRNRIAGPGGSPIGIAIPTLTTYVLDADQNPVPVGEIGELYVGGAGLARGYLNQPELTAQRFIPHPFSPVSADGPLRRTGTVARLYRSGDLARQLPGGDLEYLGRIDEQVKIRGYRIELGEIEGAMLQYPGVKHAVVVAKDDAGGSKRLVGYIVPNGVVDRTGLTQFLHTRLPDYMVPALLMPVEAIPLTTNGKVDRNALPNPDASELLPNQYVAPGNKTQENLITVWKEVLQVSRVGLDDNFFELGGNSLLAVKTVALLRQERGFDIPVTKLYQFPTVGKLADFLEGGPAVRRTKLNSQLPNQTKPVRTSGDVAVIGMAGRFPGAGSVEELWQVLREGRETIRFFSDTELDPSLPADLTSDPAYVKARGIVDGADTFDAEFFGLNPKLAEVMDPQQRVFLEIASEVLEKTGYWAAPRLPQHHESRVGVWAGCGNNTYYLNNVLQNGPVLNQVGSFQAMTVNEKDFIASRTAYQLNLKGPAVSVYSACSSSLLAITQAVESLRTGQCEVAIAGGASITAPIHSGHLYEEGAMLSRDGHCRPFDAGAGGTIFSDGAGVVLLKLLEAARQDGDTIYALIKGVGVNNDGGGKGSFTAPSAEGQAGAIQMALTDAQVDPATISYVEAHGTATPLGDPIEIEGLKLAFGEVPRNQYCAIGSIKSNMGHLTAAAGVAGFIKTALSLHHRQLPPSLGFTAPNPVIDFAGSPFFVNMSLTEWESKTVRRAGVSSFGVGGTNVHVVLEEYVPLLSPADLTESAPPRSAQLITWSAKSEASLDTYGSRLAQMPDQQRDSSLADLAYTLQTTRPVFAHRRFVVAETGDELARCVAENTAVRRTAIRTLKQPDAPGELVFLFPGQGSQYLNMGRDLYNHEPVYRQAVDTCSDLLIGHMDVAIRTILFPDIVDKVAQERPGDGLINNTRYTQPALFVTEYALAKLWMSWGMEPTVFCGHSIGEFVAAHLAGIFSLSDALMLVASRGRLISELPTGSMLSVRLSAEKVQFLIPSGVSIAAINGPRQCVVAGPDELLMPFAQSLTNRQIPNRMLETSHAFHSAMMDPILDEFETLVRSVPRQRPRKPIVSTVSGTWMTETQATDPHYWATHMRLPVLFSDALDTVFTVGNPILLEVGPGSVGVNLARQKAAPHFIQAVTSLDPKAGEGQSDTRAMLLALGELWGYGLAPDWSAFYAGQPRQRVDLPTYAFNRKPCWVHPMPVQPPVNAQSAQPVKPEIIVQTVASILTPTLMRTDILFQTVGVLLNETAGIAPEGISPASSFLELGLDSLALTQLSFKLRKTFDLPISFRQLGSEYNSLERLVAFLDSRLPANAYQPPAPVVVAPPAAPVITPPIAPVPTPLPQLDLLMGMQSTTNQPVAPIIGGDAVMNLMGQQLQLMAQQLAVLRGSTSAGPLATPVETTSQPIPALLNPTPPEETKGTDAPKPFGAGARIERQITALGETQKQFLHELVIRYNQKTAQSKAYTQQHRRWMADPRAVTGFKPLTKELVYPLVVEKSKGSRLWDIDNNEYIDVLNGFGANLFGYGPDWLNAVLHEQIEKGYEIGPQHRLAGEVCRMICSFTNFDRAALCNTGSEAVLATLRLARTVTGRSLVVVFAGSYHGIFDEVVARGASNLKSYPAALGVQPEAVQNVLILDYGTPESLQIIRERAGELAAVLVEPVQSRRPEFVPVEFLKQVREITTGSGTALIFDEVITGFRMHPGGAQTLFGIQADLAAYGKVVGGGLPIGVVAGKSAFMDALDGGFWDYGDASYPESDITFFAGTFVRHPLALAAANASLTYMQTQGPALQQSLTHKAAQLAGAMNDILTRHQSPLVVAQFGSLWKIKFTEEIPYGELLFTLMREKGIHIWDGFPCFMTEAHTEAELKTITTAFGESLLELIGAGFIPGELAPDHQDTNVPQDINHPPLSGASLGRDPAGNPGWFMADPDRPGKYVKVVSDG